MRFPITPHWTQLVYAVVLAPDAVVDLLLGGDDNILELFTNCSAHKMMARVKRLELLHDCSRDNRTAVMLHPHKS